jgi:Ca2+-transporting ATPase
MLKMLAKFGVNVEEMRTKHLGEDFVRFMFNSKRKRMSTIANNISNSKTGYDKRIHIKGAAEIVLASCAKYLDEQGNEKEMDQQVRSQLMEVIEHFGN